MRLTFDFPLKLGNHSHSKFHHEVTNFRLSKMLPKCTEISAELMAFPSKLKVLCFCLSLARVSMLAHKTNMVNKVKMEANL